MRLIDVLSPMALNPIRTFHDALANGRWPVEHVCGVLISLLAVALPQLPGQTNSAPSVHHARGRVLNSVSGAPVARALVTSPDRSFATLTDNEGRFSFEIRGRLPQTEEGPPIGFVPPRQSGEPTIPLLVVKPGYLSDNQQGQIVAGSDADITLRITPESILEGHVSALGVGAASFVPVQLFKRTVENGVAVWGQRDNKFTDSEGNFRFARLSSGDYRLLTREWTAELPSLQPAREMTSEYPPVLFPDAAVTSADAAHLAPGATFHADVAIQPARYFAIHIPIKNVQPNTGIGVEIEDSRTGSGFTLGYNGRTQSIEGSLPDGSYTVIASAYGNPGSTAVAQLTVKGSPVHAGPLTLLPYATVPVVVYEQFTHQNAADSPSRGLISAPNGLVGSGVAEQGNRPPPVTLYLRPEKPNHPGGGNFHHQPGRPDDQYVLENVPPGRYHITASSNRGYVSSAIAGGTDLSAGPLTVGLGGTVAPIYITLRDDSATLKGTVKVSSPDTTPSSSGSLRGLIYLYPFSELGQLVTTSLNQDNSFQISGIPPGRYLVLAVGRPMLEEPEYRNEEALRRFAGKGTLLTLAPGQTSEAELSLFDDGY